MKQWLAEHQPIARRMLENDLKNHDTSCPYLFAGPKGTRKKEAAVLVAQSLVCPHKEDVWACGKCAVCERVKNGQYADIKILDGSKRMIRKEEVTELQEYCAKTALEEYGEKAYILLNVDNMTPASMNSILKFLEEPGQKITAILTTDNPERLLPTIVSRCKMIPFKKPSAEETENLAKEEGLSALDAHVLAENVDELSAMQATAETESYQSGVTIWLEFVSRLAKGVYAAAYYLETDGIGATDKSKARETFGWFLNTGCVFLKDVMENRTGISEKWDRGMAQFVSAGCSAKGFMVVLLQCKDDLLAGANVNLLADRLGYRLSKEA